MEQNENIQQLRDLFHILKDVRQVGSTEVACNAALKTNGIVITRNKQETKRIIEKYNCNAMSVYDFIQPSSRPITSPLLIDPSTMVSVLSIILTEYDKLLFENKCMNHKLELVQLILNLN